MDWAANIAHGDSQTNLAYHYQGPVQRLTSDNGQATLYYLNDSNNNLYAIGATDPNGNWIDRATLDTMAVTWNQGTLSWPAGATTSTSGYAWGGGYA